MRMKARMILMCEICLRNPCHPLCPNAEEPEPAVRYSRCGDGIFAGERYYDSPSGAICEDCIEDLGVIGFMELIGEEMTIAEEGGLNG